MPRFGIGIPYSATSAFAMGSPLAIIRSGPVMKSISQSCSR
jgi:hypothetical protein